MKIDTERVIFEVHLRRCLWDKKNALYKNRDVRDAAWLEICNELVPGFENLSKNEKREVEKKVQQRWRTARDMYKRDKLSENQPSGSGAKKRKKYAYYNILTFLNTVIDVVTDDSLSESYNSPMPLSPSTLETPLPSTSASSHQYPIETPTPSTSATPDQPTPASRRVNKNKQPSEFEKQLLECLKSNHLELESEDLAFFQSLQPTLKKFNNFQKLMFRTKVLQIVMEMENTTTQIQYSLSNVSESSSQSYYSSPQIITPSPYHMQTDIHMTPAHENTTVEDIERNTFVTTNQMGMENDVSAVDGNTTAEHNYTTAPADDTAEF